MPHKQFVESASRSQTSIGTFRVLFLLAFHVMLGLLVRSSSTLSTLYAVLTLMIGFFFALTDKQPYRMVYMMGYVTGAEMLWRGTNAQIFWETGKYAISLLAIIGLLRYKGKSPADKRPIFYFVLLLPLCAHFGDHVFQRCCAESKPNEKTDARYNCPSG
jgi:hypothetical protein